MRGLTYYRRNFGFKEIISFSGIMIVLGFVSFAIARDKLVPLFALAGIVLYLSLPIRIKMMLLALGALYPLSFGDLGPIFNFYWYEWMAPIMFILLWHDTHKEGLPLIPKGAGVFIFGLACLISAAVINFVLNPVSAERLFGASEAAGGLRRYYAIFAGACIFFSAMWFGQRPQALHTWLAYLRVLVWFSVGLGALRIASFYMKFDIPFVFGVFRHGSEIAFLRYAGIAYRIGGLSEAACIGIAALLALRYRAALKWIDFVALGVFGFFLFLSGGRSAFLGVVAAICLYLIISRKKVGRFVAVIMGTAMLWTVLVGTEIFSGQINRLLALEGGIRHQSPERWYTYEYMWGIFLHNPLLGKGIGFTSQLPVRDEFIIDQLKVGGHGAYISILCIMGIPGGMFLAIFLFGSLLKGLRGCNAQSSLSNAVKMWYVFIVLMFTVKLFTYTVGGNGYSDMGLYLLSGALFVNREKT